MPTLLFVDGFRFFIYSNENDEPIHVHVEKGDGTGKIWLEPQIIVAYFYNFNSKQQKKILEIIRKNSRILKDKWDEHFAK